MKALKLKSSPDSDPVFGEISRKCGRIIGIHETLIPYLFADISITFFTSNLDESLSVKDFLEKWELVPVSIKIKRAVKELPHAGDTVFN